MKKLRLHQFLSKTGVFATKHDSISALNKGEITIDGKVTRDAQFQFDPRKRVVLWKGNKLAILSLRVYIILNKPKAYICSRLTARDRSLGKRSLFSLLEKTLALDEQLFVTLFCVGRLDEDSSGLILITNDGDLGAQITNPENGIEKTYSVLLEKPLTQEQQRALEHGVTIQLEENEKILHYTTRPCSVERDTKIPLLVRITLTEGKKREVRRMISAVGHVVVSLQRIALGAARLDDLALREGESVFVSANFVKEVILKSKKSVSKKYLKRKE